MRKSIIGFYGKIPSHRDFIHSNLPRAFVDAWDPWLQEVIAHWRNELKGDWVADYLTMTPYRFILSKGVAGEVNWLGVLVPSRDHVGRLFPLTICIPLPSSISPLKLQQLSGDWLDTIETLAIDCLQPDFDPEIVHTTFTQQLVTLGLPDITNLVSRPHIAPEDLLHETSCSSQNINTMQKQFSFALNPSQDRHLPLAESLLEEYCHSYSLWWSKNDKTILHSQGLPHKTISPALIDKQWNKWGWLANPDSSTVEKNDKEDDTQAFR